MIYFHVRIYIKKKSYILEIKMHYHALANWPFTFSSLTLYRSLFSACKDVNEGRKTVSTSLAILVRI